MKKSVFFKPFLGFICLLTLTMCSEDGPIQFIVEDDFNTTAVFVGVADESSFANSGLVDISELASDANEVLKKAEIKSITLTLQDDFSRSSLTFDATLKTGPSNVIVLMNNQTITLTKGTSLTIDLTTAVDILSYLTSNNSMLSYDFSGASETTIGDDDFSILISLEVSSIVEIK